MGQNPQEISRSFVGLVFTSGMSLFLVLSFSFAHLGCERMPVDVWRGVSGKVIDKASQEPIVSAHVELGDTISGQTVAEAYSDSSGNFVMEALSIGNSILYARKTGYRTAQLQLQFDDNIDLTGIVIEMEKTVPEQKAIR